MRWSSLPVSYMIEMRDMLAIAQFLVKFGNPLLSLVVIFFNRGSAQI